MEHYHKERVVKESKPKPNPWDIQISQGCKLKNVIAHALKQLSERDTIFFTGSGAQVSKAISVVEIVKRRRPSLHQVTKIFYTTLEDTWVPNEETKGLDSLKATRHIPTIMITLSKVTFPQDNLGYQAPGGVKKDLSKGMKDELSTVLQDICKQQQ